MNKNGSPLRLLQKDESILPAKDFRARFGINTLK